MAGQPGAVLPLRGLWRAKPKPVNIRVSDSKKPGVEDARFVVIQLRARAINQLTAGFVQYAVGCAGIPFRGGAKPRIHIGITLRDHTSL